MLFCSDFFFGGDRFLNLIFFLSFFSLAFFVRGETTRLWFSCKIRNPKWTVARTLGFLPLTSILEETEIEILAGESLQGLFDFPLKRNQVPN